MEVKERDCVKWMHFPVYAGLSPLWINQVKSGLNAAAWLNGRIQKFDHISTHIWDELLWWRHEFKILLLIHNSLTSCALGNYRELCISLALDLFALQYKMFWLSLCTVVLQCNGVGPLHFGTDCHTTCATWTSYPFSISVLKTILSWSCFIRSGAPR